jgi:hypothetical protein
MTDIMANIGVLLVGLICLVLAVYVIFLPIFISRKKGIQGNTHVIICILTWVGLLCLGATWFIALLMALFCSNDVKK